uniref:Putative secreted protein n=1 Tax=Anopheles triannulatus TaxID=58253 RepID=A0A2M4B7U1_9DIPT
MHPLQLLCFAAPRVCRSHFISFAGALMQSNKRRLLRCDHHQRRLLPVFPRVLPKQGATQLLASSTRSNW